MLTIRMGIFTRAGLFPHFDHDEFHNQKQFLLHKNKHEKNIKLLVKQCNTPDWTASGVHKINRPNNLRKDTIG